MTVGAHRLHVVGLAVVDRDGFRERLVEKLEAGQRQGRRVPPAPSARAVDVGVAGNLRGERTAVGHPGGPDLAAGVARQRRILLDRSHAVRQRLRADPLRAVEAGEIVFPGHRAADGADVAPRPVAEDHRQRAVAIEGDLRMLGVLAHVLGEHVDAASGAARAMPCRPRWRGAIERCDAAAWPAERESGSPGPCPSSRRIRPTPPTAGPAHPPPPRRAPEIADWSSAAHRRQLARSDTSGSGYRSCRDRRCPRRRKRSHQDRPRWPAPNRWPAIR